MIRILSECESPICQSDLSDYVCPLTISIVGYTELCERVLLGKIQADQVKVGDAQTNGQSLFDICDSDSQGLHDAYVSLFNKKGEIRKCLDLEVVTENFLFIYKAVTHPILSNYLQGIIQSVSVLFGNDTLIGMWDKTVTLSDKEMSELGFRRIARSNLVYRHASLRSSFTDSHPFGIDVDSGFEPNESNEEWVVEQFSNSRKVNSGGM